MKDLVLKILIVEDEFVTISNLKSILTNEGYQVSGIAKSANEALEVLKSKPIDLIIIDINIKGEFDGIWLANRIKTIYDIPHIFLTAYCDKKTVASAVETNPYAYLIKPFTKESIFASINIAIKQYSKSLDDVETSEIKKTEEENYGGSYSFTEKFFFIKDKGVFQKIFYQDILYASAELKYIDIYIKQGKRYTFRCNLIDFIGSLPTGQFFRSHRSYVVNIDLVDGIGDNYLVIGKTEVPLASIRKKELLTLFHLK